MQCPVCNHNLPDQNQFCNNCGAKIPRCPTCGQAILTRLRFCTNDGTPLPEEIFSSLPAQPSPAGQPAQQPSSVNQKTEPRADETIILNKPAANSSGQYPQGQRNNVPPNTSQQTAAGMPQQPYNVNMQQRAYNAQRPGQPQNRRQYQGGQPQQQYQQYQPGQPQRPQQPEEPEKKSKKTLLIIIIIAAAVILIAAGIFVWLFMTDKISFGSGKESTQIESSEGGLIDRSLSDEEDESDDSEESTEEETTTEETTPEETTTEEETEEETEFSDLTGDDAVQAFILTSDTVTYTLEDIEGWDADMCRLARNGIYARHGRLFDAEDLQEYFNNCDWYEGTVNPDDFNESVFNSVEKANRDLIVEYEELMGYR